jgi:hypothetical protein
MRVWSRRGLTAVVVAAVLMASFGGAVRAQTAGPPDPDTPAPLYTINSLGPTKGDNVILLWDEELLQAIRANPAGTGPTITARALGVAPTSMFDAWAAYGARAIGTRYGGHGRAHAGEQEQGDQLRRLRHPGRPVPVPRRRLRPPDEGAGLRRRQVRHLDPGHGRADRGPGGDQLPPQGRLQMHGRGLVPRPAPTPGSRPRPTFGRSTPGRSEPGRR